MKFHSKFNTTLLSAGSILAISSVAFAQPANRPADQTAQAAPQDNVETVEITGSRINSTGFQSPTPVTAVTAADLSLLSPTSISDGLRQLPSLFGSNGAAAAGAQPSSASSNITQFAGAFLNLRNLGAVRTLILEDGDRVPPTRADGQVDSSLMPQMLTKRVDIVTGGASAIYGSDAVAGVINYVTDNTFEGVKFEIQGGASQHFDNGQYGAGIAAGTSLLGGKLHLVGSAEFSRNYGIESMCARPLGCMDYTGYGAAGSGANGQSAPGTTAQNPWGDGDLPYGGNTSVSYYGNVTVGPAGLKGMKFTDPTGVTATAPLGSTPSTITTFNTTPMASGSTCYTCDGGDYAPKNQYLVPPLATYHGFFRGQYDITNNLNAWVRATYGSSNLRDQGVVQFSSNNLVIQSGNAFLPAAAQTILTNTNTKTFTMSKEWQTLPNGRTWGGTSAAIVSAGLNGTFGDSWLWSASGSDGQSTNGVRGSELKTANYFSAIDAVRAPAGNAQEIAAGTIVCNITLTNPGAQPGCVPLDPFGPTSSQTVTPTALPYVLGNYKYSQDTNMKDARLNLSGDLFKLPAGPLAVSTGYEYRRLGLTVKSDNVTPDLTGVRSPATTLEFLYNNILSGGGSYDVNEAYAEAAIPVVKNLPFVQALDLSVAGRFTRYSISGDVTTWKVGATWDVNDDVRLRGTISRDIRAPTLNDFFAPLTYRNVGFTDSLTNSAGIVTQVTGGSLLLKPEKALTDTYGVVLSPHFLPGFTMSVDVYHIAMADEIAAPFSAGQIEQACSATGGTDPFYCPFVTRPLPYTNITVANYPKTIFVGNGNISKEVVTGTDWEVAYTTPLFGGDLNLHMLATYQPTDITLPLPTSVPINNASVGRPKLNANFTASYRTNDWTFTWLERMVNSYMQGSANPTTPRFYSQPEIPPVFYTNLNVSKTFTDMETGWKYQLAFNITNAFDQDPPLLPGQTLVGFGYPTQPTYYDVIGRQFSLTFRGNL